MAPGFNIKEQARAIFTEALRAVDAGAAVRDAVKLSGFSRLTVVDEVYELTGGQPQVYAVAFGKAAYPMALALDGILGDKLIGGVISGVLPEEGSADGGKVLSSKWRMFSGGHPLPNEASLAAAKSCFNLLRAANNKQALVIFLISGGGSAMIEAPSDDSITLADLRETNRSLVSCGASIAEVNTVRRALSQIKGGRLAAFAQHAVQISLIISDTEPGDEASVASGPTIVSASFNPYEVKSIIKRYNLASRLPNPVLDVLLRKTLEKTKPSPKNLRRHHVLLDNQSAVAAAIAKAENFGFVVEVAADLSQQLVEIGCAEIAWRMRELCERIGENKIACLVSGGEFSCPVRGTGAGGRNSETVLRMALMFDENSKRARENLTQAAFLSAGTDGIDGNSPAAGAICDNTTLERSQAFGLDARYCLDNSDAYTFFHALGDAVITRPTGTNVRDLRIMIARK
jgi:glycerate 2-kinase